MERLIIVVDCPDSWRERINPRDVAYRVMNNLQPTPDLPLIPVRARWGAMDAESAMAIRQAAAVVDTGEAQNDE